MKTITFIVGGGRCGKSSQALSLAQDYTGSRVFIATAEPVDDEMDARIRAHQKERDGAFVTIEEPLDLARALCAIPDNSSVVVIDCLTVWLGNLMHCHGAGKKLSEHIDTFVLALDDVACDVIIVANEVGMGIIPENAMARQFRDLAGMLNQKIAKKADRAILMVAGMAVHIKKET